MFYQNLLRIFDNRADAAPAFVTALQNAFEDVKWELVGTVLLFEARRPRKKH